MVRYQAKKFVVVCFLEAAKTVIDHLGQHRMQLAQEGQEGPKDLVATYSDIRRLRDYLQRCLGAFPETVEFDIGIQDQALLVACAQRAVEVLDLHLDPNRTMQDEERNWLMEKRRVLSDWAVALVQKPMVELPLPRLSGVQTAGVNALNGRITNKLRQPRRLEGPAGNAAGTNADPAFAGPVDEPLPLPPGMVVQGSENPVPDPGRLPGPASAHEPLPVQGTPALVDPRHVHDPRLRALMVLDVRAFDRAVEAHDYRLAAVHLSSIMEGAVLDHAIPRRTELGLVGAPDSWNPQEILVTVMGELVSPKDRSVVYHVFAARNLIRPTAQLVAPSVVTLQSLEKLTEFVRRALRHMGFQVCTEETARATATANTDGDGPQAQAGA